MTTLRAALFVAAVTALLKPAVAEPPFVSYIFPAGGQRGTTVDFKVGGHYLHEGAAFHMTGSGVSATDRIERTETIWFEGPVIPQPASQRKEDYPKDYAGSVEIADDATLGARHWRVTTSQGVTSRMQFQVGDLPEIVEEEIDGDPVPVAVQLPVTINGRIFPREDVDIWTFEATAGQRFSCEVSAARLGSPLDSRLEIRAPNGRTIAQNVDTFGSDSFVTFETPASGTYECRIHDINFGGLQHFVYRLSIRDGSYVRSTYPLGGRRGEFVNLLLGGTNTPASPVAVEPPANAGDAFDWQLPGEPFASNPVRLAVGDFPEFLESEPNDVLAAESDEDVPSPAANVRDFTVPATLNGQINQPGDVDLWRFTAEPGTTLAIEVTASRLGTPLDSVLSVLSSDMKQLTMNDDLKSGVTDSRLKWKVPAGEHFYLEIRDRFSSRGGEDFAYRIEVSQPEAESAVGFGLVLPADAVNVTAGDEAGLKVKLTVDRSAGYKGEIEVSADGLPDGVTLEGTTIGKNRPNATLVFKADASAKIGLSTIRLVGRSTDEDTDLTATAVFKSPTGGADLSDIPLAVAVKTPFRFFSPFETKYASRGTVYGRTYQIERGDYDGPIEIELADRQVRHLQGVTGGKIVVPPGESEFYYDVSLPPWMEIGRTSRTCLMASAFVTDADGKKHRVSYTSQGQDDQIICLVDPVRISIDTPRKSIGIRPGQQLELPIKVTRGTGLTGPVTVTLKSPAHVRGCTAEPINIAADKTEAVLSITFAEDELGPFNSSVMIEAVIQDERRRPVRSECAMRFVVLD